VSQSGKDRGSLPSYKSPRWMRMYEDTVRAKKKVQSPVWRDCTLVQILTVTLAPARFAKQIEVQVLRVAPRTTTLAPHCVRCSAGEQSPTQSKGLLRRDASRGASAPQPYSQRREIHYFFVSLSWNKTRLRRVSDDLGAVLQMQAIQDFSHVILDRPFGDADGHGNLTVGLSLCDQRQDL